MIRFRALGPVELAGPGGEPLLSVLAQPRRLALLAYLTLARPAGFHRRDTLLALFWPDSDTAHARDALSQALRFLRRSLGDQALPGRGAEEVGILGEAVWCDVVALEAALDAGREEEVLELYRGDLLEGFNIGDAPEFERWLDGERQRLRSRAAGAAAGLATHAAQEGNPAGAARWARRSAELVPFDEAAHCRLLQYLDAAGDRAGALQEHEGFRRRLKQELESEPAPETTALVEAIRARERRAPPIAAGAEPASSGATRPGPAAVEIAASRTAPPAVPRTGGWIVVAVAALVLVLAAVGFMLARNAAAPAPPMSAAAADGAAAAAARVAVLYFDDLTPGGGDEPLAAGLTESLIDKLEQAAPGLTVTSADGVRPFRGTRASPDSIARALGVATLVTGSVMRSGHRVRVYVRLVSGSKGVMMDNTTVEEPDGELFALVDDVVRQASLFLRRRLGPVVQLQEWRAGTSSQLGWELVQRAHQSRYEAEALAGSGEQDAALAGLVRADSLLARAERADAAWATPTVQRGWVAMRTAIVELRISREREAIASLERAVAHGTRALAHSPDDAGALELRGSARRYIWLLQQPRESAAAAALLTAAERDLQDAVDGDPHRAQAWSGLSAIRLDAGDFVGAETAAARAFKEDAWAADYGEVLWRAFFSAFQRGEDDDARRWCDELGHRNRGEEIGVVCALKLAAWGKARPDVRAAWARVREIGGESPAAEAQNRPVVQLAMAAVLARAGLSDSARALLARAPLGAPALLRPEADVRVLLHEQHAALDLLRRYVAAYPHQGRAIGRDRCFTRLLADPWFHALGGR